MVDLMRSILLALIAANVCMGTAHAQSYNPFPDSYFHSPATDYGAGYKIIMVNTHQQYPSSLTNDDSPMVNLVLSYPIIALPLTPDEAAYNTEIKTMIARWWKDIGAPADKLQATDPGTDYTLICTPGAGIGNGESSPLERMLPGVISTSCSAYIFPHGAAHGGGKYWGFNWVVAQRRSITPEDIFTPNSGWLTALTSLLDTDRQSNAANPNLPKLGSIDIQDFRLGACL